VVFSRFEVNFQGEHNIHRVTYDEGRWRCTCEEAARMGVCSHIMALERILGDSVLPDQKVMPVPELVS